MNKYIMASTSGIKFGEKETIKVERSHSLGRVEVIEDRALFDGVKECKVVKIIANTNDEYPILNEGDTHIVFSSNGLEFENDEAALLWFKLNYEI
jgi:hypothetical protein